MEYENKNLGSYLKTFISGSTYSLSIKRQNGDWGISCGLYNMTLKSGDCISFLKKYFPENAKHLHYNELKKNSEKYPGILFCSTPDAVRSVWVKCYNKTDSSVFGEYEYEYMKETYYDKLKEKIKPLIDLDNSHRMIQEVFWSWSFDNISYDIIYEKLNSFLSNNNQNSFDFIYMHDLINFIYDYRYSVTNSDKYLKTDGGVIKTERDCVLSVTPNNTFCGISYEEYQEILEEKKIQETQERIKAHNEEIKEKIENVEDIFGNVKIISKEDIIYNYNTPDSDDILERIYYNDIFEVDGVTLERDYYRTPDNKYIKVNDTMVVPNTEPVLCKLKVVSDSIKIYDKPDNNSNIIGYGEHNQVFNISKKDNNYYKIQSMDSWIELNNDVKLYE